ncbi:MAG: M23 family metallopeptidase [Cyclobacteriaceae bacterium]
MKLSSSCIGNIQLSKLTGLTITLALILSGLLPHNTLAQDAEPYYMFPINPGKQNYLAGTMGELRSSHFHAGIDIKTGGKEGLPVYAAADGYISRIRVSTGGYGYALYMNHPNGTTSVYAHLSKFESSMADFIFEEQYKQETYTIQMFPQRDQFNFKKGDIIGYSGNTGSSSGPHLHFEIRDANQRILDPLKYNFSEIIDNIAPQVKKIAFVSLDQNARINGTFGRFEFDIIKNDKGIYQTRNPIKLSGNIGVEIYAFDYLNGVYNRNGIPETTLVIDGDTVFREFKNRMAFSKQRSILVHMDYDAYRNTGVKFNKLFIDHGNTNDIYEVPSRGFHFNDSIHDLSIYFSDSYGNLATLQTTVNKRRIVNLPDPDFGQFEIYRGVLHIKKYHEKSIEPVQLYFGDALIRLEPYRVDKRVSYSVWDLTNGIPDSIYYGGEILQTDIFGELPSQTEMSFHNHHLDIALSKKSLFDTLYLRFEKSYDTLRNLEIFNFPHWDTPLRSSVKVTLKPEQSYTDSLASVYSVYGDNLGYIGGDWSEDGITIRTSDLTKFTIAEDSVPPVIDPIIIDQKRLVFKITDELSGISEYQASLNGKFLLMGYEPKKQLIWAIPKSENIPISGEFILEVEDNTGNKAFYNRKLK